MTDPNVTPPNPGQPAYQPAPQAGYQPAPAAPSKTLSIISMVAGIVGILSSGFFGLAAIAAVVLGFMGKKREGEPAKGFWLTGIITGFVGIAIMVIVLGVIIAGAIAAASLGTTTYDY